MLCHRCKEDKLDIEFGKVNRKYAAREKNLWCRKCCNEYQRNYKKVWSVKNPEKLAAQKRRYIIRTYGIEPDAYDALILKQNGCCAICGSAPKKYSLHIDHCHTTNIVRGLLCGSCNRLLGMACDDIKLLKNAILYLKRNNGVK